MEREKGLQSKYAELQLQIKELQEQYQFLQDEIAASQVTNGNNSTGSAEVSSTTNGDTNGEILEYPSNDVTVQ